MSGNSGTTQEFSYIHGYVTNHQRIICLEILEQLNFFSGFRMSAPKLKNPIFSVVFLINFSPHLMTFHDISTPCLLGLLGLAPGCWNADHRDRTKMLENEPSIAVGSFPGFHIKYIKPNKKNMRIP